MFKNNSAELYKNGGTVYFYLKTSRFGYIFLVPGVIILSFFCFASKNYLFFYIAFTFISYFIFNIYLSLMVDAVYMTLRENEITFLGKEEISASRSFHCITVNDIKTVLFGYYAPTIMTLEVTDEKKKYFIYSPPNDFEFLSVTRFFRSLPRIEKESCAPENNINYINDKFIRVISGNILISYSGPFFYSAKIDDGYNVKLIKKVIFLPKAISKEFVCRSLCYSVNRFGVMTVYGFVDDNLNIKIECSDATINTNRRRIVFFPTVSKLNIYIFITVAGFLYLYFIFRCYMYSVKKCEYSVIDKLLKQETVKLSATTRDTSKFFPAK